MNLSERLQVKDYNSMFGRRYCFKHLGFLNDTYAKLIDFVLERFARRYGNVENDKALFMQIRLSRKYTNGNLNTLKQLKSDYLCGFSYPKSQAQAASEPILKRIHEEQDFKKSLELEYKFPTAKYCITPRYHGCTFCECPCVYSIKYPDGRKDSKYTGTHLNGVLVCNSKKCRAIAAFYKTNHAWPELKLVNAILDAVKNNENRRKLEKHFIENA